MCHYAKEIYHQFHSLSGLFTEEHMSSSPTSTDMRSGTTTVCVHKDLYGVGPACISPGFPMSLWQLQVLVRSEFDECSTLASVETLTITRCWNFLVCSHAEQLIRTSDPLSWCQRRRGSIPWNFLRRKLWATPTCVHSSERMHWLDGVVHRK